jgi:hypothetical protein
MSTTYTAAADRASHQVRAARWRLEMRDAALVAASCIALFAIALAGGGTLRALDASDGLAPRANVVNLNTVADSGALEQPLSLVFTNPSDRRSVARELFRFLAEYRERGRQVPNVGALARARSKIGSVPAAGLLLTSPQFTLLKPSFTVRTREDFKNHVFLFSLLYVLGFHVTAFVCRLRGTRTDTLLLVVAHLLTAIGFAALLARPDPVRDTFLVGRYVEGILLGLTLMTAVSLINFRTVAFLELSYVPLLAALSSSRRISARRSSPAACFLPSTRWRGAEPEWPSLVSPCSCWASMSGTRCTCRRRWPIA